MRSRWFHKPVLNAAARHGHQGHGKRVTWLELFYDLIFVAGIIQLGDYLSGNVTPSGFGLFALHFVPLWAAWTGFSFFENRFALDDLLHRVMVLAQMFALGAMAICAPDAMEAISHPEVGTSPAGFAIAYAVAQWIIALMYLRVAVQGEPESEAYARFWGRIFAFAGAAFFISAWVPPPWTYVVWAVAIGGLLFAPLAPASRALREQHPLDFHHLSERFGLLTIIVLGESFVKVLGYLSGHGAEPRYLLKGFFNLGITCALWWIYFDDVAGAKLKKQRGTWIVWLYSHIPLTLAITAVGVAVKLAIKFELDAVMPAPYRWLLAGTLALTLFSVAVIDSVTERRIAELSDSNRVIVRAVSGLVVLLLGQVGGSMSALTFIALITAIMVAQVLFDLMMAPLEETEEIEQAIAIREMDAKARDGATAKARPDVGTAVRRGAPSELRRDLYFFFMEGSWTRLLLSFGFLYLALNVLFAALFMLEEGSISGGHHGFADAFNFSIQTFTTIGYGAMSPATDYGDVVVTLEAAAGMLFAALGTGLIFAKASQPQSSVLFSKVAVVSMRNGVPTLTFRAANARGNEVVDAHVSIAAMIDEVSPEGHHMRALHDLTPTRGRSPMFALSWLVMCPLDEQSPLYGLSEDDVEDRLLAITVTLMGHDATYGQQTHARTIYYPEDIVFGQRFVDVISQLPDGRLMIDLHSFHDVTPDLPGLPEPRDFGEE